MRSNVTINDTKNMIGFDLFKTCAPANCNIEPKNEKEQITAQ